MLFARFQHPPGRSFLENSLVELVAFAIFGVALFLLTFVTEWFKGNKDKTKVDETPADNGTEKPPCPVATAPIEVNGDPARATGCEVAVEKVHDATPPQVQVAPESSHHPQSSENQNDPMQMSVDSKEPKGVGGWLAFFCFGLTVLGPLSSTLYMVGSWTDAQPAFGEFPSLRTIIAIENSAVIALLIYGVITGCSIWSGNRSGRSMAQRYLLIRLVGFVVVEFAVGLIIMRTMPADVASETGRTVFRSFVREIGFFLIWSLYFRFSKRVRNTYGDKEQPIEMPGLSSSSEPVPSNPIAVESPNRESLPMTEQNITCSPVSRVLPDTLSNKAEWHVIHAGQEIGPLTLSEIVDRAAAAEIGPDDLVKETRGLWTKAKDFSFLQPHFVEYVRRGSNRAEAIERLSHPKRFYGIWISRQSLAIAGAGFTVAVIAWIIGSRTSETHDPSSPQRFAADPTEARTSLARNKLNVTGAWNLQIARALHTLELTDRNGHITGIIKLDPAFSKSASNVTGSRIGSSIELFWSSTTVDDANNVVWTDNSTLKGTVEANRMFGSCTLDTTLLVQWSGKEASNSRDYQWIANRRQ